ncbi:MAG: RNA-binding transcriptional accessory protein [Chloroflexi bacterium]|nr:RNA-binding transcriptional accessory protein [Chloroflexota bacterium]
MNEPHVARTARELGLGLGQVQATADLLGEGATVPFVARYRKEATGSLDEVAITAIRDRLAQLEALDDRRRAIVTSLQERELLTDELQRKLDAAETLAALEDVYQPFRPRRRTRASVARERGLEPLADSIVRQDPRLDPQAEAARYVTPADATVAEELRVADAEAALQGARDILAERVNDDAEARARIRRLFWHKGVIRTQVRSGKESGGAKFADYFDWSEPVANAPSHRVLAMLRGEAEDILACGIQPPEEEALAILERLFVRGTSRSSEHVRVAVRDGYKRLLARSMETETRAEAKQRADSAAIRVFAQNLRQLLLSPPLGQKRLLAIDPGLRTGCKTVVLDAQGQLVLDTVIYPDQSQQRRREAAETLLRLVREHRIEAVAIGNGTGGRETEAFVRGLDLPRSVGIVMVNEAGASVYSASDVARAEFPDRDITVRGAVSIGRRLMDPLAELVKIDPKSIGVGQYQHDVDQDALRQSLDDVVVSCVNFVGVEVNTASKQLLTYVSGLSATVADNIVRYRADNGPFKRRQDLVKVPRLGPKAFEQAAGFLRIHGAANPLDRSAVHPESYAIVDRMAADLGVGVADVIGSDSVRARLDLSRYISFSVGLPTLTDIVAELAKPGRDPRATFEVVQFREGIHSLEDVQPGMTLPGVVTNVTAFGAFVDIGVHQDGLVHISQLADRFVRDPNEVVSVQQPVQVTVLEVDRARRRISLSMRKNASVSPAR